VSLEHLLLSWYKLVGGPVELEGVGAVAVGGVLGHVLREVDDHDRVERALLHADATPGSGWRG